jgi:hypothetical protein
MSLGAVSSTTSPEPGSGTVDRNKFRIAAILGYFGTCILCLAILAWVMKLWNADLAVPFHWQLAPDVNLHLMLFKNLVEKGGLYTNVFLGAPNHLELYDFPQPYYIHYLFIQVLSLFSRNFNVVFNLYFLLTFPLIAITSLFVFRRFGASWTTGILGGLLFTFLPYHFMRGEAHFFLGTYYSVPLTILMALWICTGEVLFRFQETADERRLVTPKGLICVASCVVIGLDNPYYVFFSAFFLIVAGATACLRYRRRGTIRSTGVLLVILLTTFGIGLAPSVYYRHLHGRDSEVLQRSPSESEYFGLKVAQLILPVTGHRIQGFARRKNSYNHATISVNENDDSSLGLIGTCGFLFLLAWLMFGRGETDTHTLLGPLSILNISALLLCTMGGFGNIFAFAISPAIRSYNRVSVYVGFLAVFTVVLLLERLRQDWTEHVWRRPLRNVITFRILIASLLVLGVLDQTTPGFVPHYREIKSDYQSDADFVYRIEASVPPNAMIFQLPYHPFPEKKPESRMWDYDHLRGYLHSKDLRWSYGAMKGREGDLWEKNVAAMQTKAMVTALVSAGFNGIYVDRFGYADQGAKLESELADALNTTPIVSSNQRLSFVSFAKARGSHVSYLPIR